MLEFGTHKDQRDRILALISVRRGQSSPSEGFRHSRADVGASSMDGRQSAWMEAPPSDMCGTLFLLRKASSQPEPAAFACLPLAFCHSCFELRSIPVSNCAPRRKPRPQVSGMRRGRPGRAARRPEWPAPVKIQIDTTVKAKEVPGPRLFPGTSCSVVVLCL